MNAAVMLDRDDIRVFLPNIGEAEHALRAKMRSYRNAASAMVSRTESDTARQLAWIVVEYGCANLYAPATEPELEDLNKLFKRLMITAIHVENIDQFGPGVISSGGPNHG
ncbi:hypothetical protein [Altererythrobacter sp. GH1-8]|uniref:hypothetical protein n=1 Tax=Altererythrobacter sp. GH1-8 TaxID=3349333 RepID=UPI00374D4391